MTTSKSIRIIGIDDVPANRKRGGEMRTLLSPGTVGCESGFMGVAILAPGERVVEHFHPYSEEFLYLMAGEVTIDLDSAPHVVRAGQGLVVPTGMRHRVRNTGTEQARIVFHLSPLAPQPALGHVDTEELV